MKVPKVKKEKVLKIRKAGKLRQPVNSYSNVVFEPTVGPEPEPQSDPIVETKIKSAPVKEEPTILRLSKKFARIGGAALGGYLGGQFGFFGTGIKEGEKYGVLAGEYAAKKLIEYAPILGSFKKGGRVKKTGTYLLHKGEKIIPAK